MKMVYKHDLAILVLLAMVVLISASDFPDTSSNKKADVLVSSHTLEEEQQKLSAYNVLQQYDFPVGLLPIGATGYELDSNTGKFTVYLNETCSFHHRSYELKYEKTIIGIISKGRLAELNGVSVKALALWFNIVEVTRDGDTLRFSVGFASSEFGVDDFSVSPHCESGFDFSSSSRKNYDDQRNGEGCPHGTNCFGLPSPKMGRGGGYGNPTMFVDNLRQGGWPWPEMGGWMPSIPGTSGAPPPQAVNGGKPGRGYDGGGGLPLSPGVGGAMSPLTMGGGGYGDYHPPDSSV